MKAGRVLWAALVTLALASSGGAMAKEVKATTLFGAGSLPSEGPAMPIGEYAKGCAAGQVELPETGPTWQAMRLSRNRNWGQPVTIAFLEDLSRTATTLGWRGLYIGDISQPRGGPAASGHASHQIGLDVDIWMLMPDRLNLTRRERENLSSVSIRTDDQLGVTKYWTPAHVALLKAAASDPRVDRIFIAAAAKIAMCKIAKPSDTKWLQKIRPYSGHNEHFHVRLKCPPGATTCQTQTPTVDELSNGGNGCDDTLMYWVSDAYLHPKPTNTPAPHVRGARDYTLSDLPAQCKDVLSSAP